MGEERRRILDLLAAGSITAQEAEMLLAATEADAGGKGGALVRPLPPKYLRVSVMPAQEGDASQPRVNVRVPLQLLRAGMKLGAMMPPDAQASVSEALEQQGIKINLADLKPETLDELIEALADLTVDVDEEKVKVRVFCER